MSQTSNTTTAKVFFWRDKSGRGETANVELANMGESDNEETSYEGQPLYDWALEAQEGDSWSNESDEYLCISVNEAKKSEDDLLSQLEAMSADIQKAVELTEKISAAWDKLPISGSEVLACDYPFDSSFDDLASDFRKWSASVKQNIAYHKQG